MKAEVRRPSAAAVSSSEMTDAAAAWAAPPVMAADTREEQEEMEMRRASFDDKDLLCPICMGLIRDAFLTACGHSFCYMCIVTHLNNKSDCPCCAHYLTKNHLFPNFLLNKFLDSLILDTKISPAPISAPAPICIRGLILEESRERIDALVDELFATTKKLIKATSKEIEKWR